VSGAASGTSPELTVSVGLNAYLWGGTALPAADAGGAQ
jgi:hypothetical protein